MTLLQRVSLTTLLVGLIGAVFVVPWSIKNIRNAEQNMKAYQELVAEADRVAPASVPAPDQQADAARRESAAQAARIKAALDKLAYPEPVAPPPLKRHPAYSFAAPGYPELMPLEGWVDQPDKSKPGRVHTDLMVRHVKPSVRPRVASRAPCLVMVAKPAQRIERSYGWLEVPARTIPVPCGK
jgi:hypothetical protein